MSVHENAISIDLFEDELAALVKVGGYDSERYLIRDALEALVTANPSLRLELAIALWQQDKVTMGRAIEIGQSDRESFREELVRRGIPIIIDVDSNEIINGAERIRQLRLRA